MCFLRLGAKFNKRQGAMNKLTNIVHSGWMTKSPPEQKLQSPLKIFRAKWKQRFFVLHKPSGSLPDQYELSYYNSEHCTKKKGSIDLDQCEQIIESLDSDQYPYLLAIKTICRSKERTYYLATNSEGDMGTWVQCLCRVCGLKQEDTPTDIPETRLSTHSTHDTPAIPLAVHQPVVNSNTVRATAAVTSTITSQPVQVPPSRPPTVTSSSSSDGSHPPLSTSPQSYVLLNQCTTGIPEKPSDRYRRADSIDSVPEYQAPPPPCKKGSQVHNNNNDDTKSSLHDSVFELYDHPRTASGQETYDRPVSGLHEYSHRPRSDEFRDSQASLDDTDDLYKVPPNSTGQVALPHGTGNSTTDSVNLNAAVPLAASTRSPNLTSLRDRPESASSTGRPVTENYDIPPQRRISTSSKDGSGSGSNPPTPPLRPPKPVGLMTQSPYQNLPSNSKVCEKNSLNAVPSAPAKTSASPFSYDIPRVSNIVSPPRDLSALEIAPPAPAPRQNATTASHSYLNTVPGLHDSPTVPPFPDSYFSKKNREKGDHESAFDQMDAPQPSQCKSTATTDKTYTEMGGVGIGRDLYQVPPVAPHPPSRSVTAPHGYRTACATGAEAEPAVIWSNVRTKSFKRNNQVNKSPTPVRPPPLEPRRPPLPFRSNEFASSSEDDDNVSIDGNNTHHDLSMVRMSTVPAPPDLDTEPELKYLDLALDTPPDPLRHQAAASHGTPTEYREIDFVKTEALQATKKARNMKQ